MGIIKENKYKMKKTLRNLITGLGIGLASAGLMRGLEDKVRAETPRIVRGTEVGVEGKRGLILEFNGQSIPLRGAPKTLNRDEFNTLEIGYDPGLDRFFLKSGEINNIAFGSISSDDRVYMFIGEEVPANFNEDFFKVDFTNKKVEIGAKADSEGVYVNFYPDNPVISVDENQILSTKAIGHYNPTDEEKKNYGWNEWSDKSRVIIEDREKDIIPLIETKGAFEVISGEQFVWYDKNSKIPLISPNYVKTGKNSVGVGIQSFDSEGKPIQYTIKENNVDKTITLDGSTFINENGDMYFTKDNLGFYEKTSVSKEKVVVSSFSLDNRRFTLKLSQGKNYGGLEDKFGEIWITAKNSEVTVQDRSKWNWIPLVTVIGKGNYDASISFYDNFAVSVYEEQGETNVGLATCGLEEKKGPAFQLKIGPERTDAPAGWEDYFVDNFRRLTKANRGVIMERGKNNPSIYFHVDRDDENQEEYDWRDNDLYFPTKAFAAVKDKDRFWMRTTYDDQLRMKNASFNELQRYAGPTTQFEKRIIQNHWRDVGRKKRQMEQEYFNRTGKRISVDPEGAFMSDEDILRDYYIKKEIREKG